MRLLKSFVVVFIVFFSTIAFAGESTNPFGKFFGDLKKNIEKSVESMDIGKKKPDSKNKDLGAEKISPILNQDVDIVGIKLGITVSEAETAIKKHNGEMKITKRFTALNEVPDTDFVSNLLGLFGPKNMEKGTEVILIRFLRPPDPTVVGMIQRTLTFKMSEAPTLENTKASLFEKYGKPNDASNMRTNEFQWAFYENGELINDLKDSRACKVRVQGLNITDIHVKGDRWMFRDRNQNKNNMKCGLSIGVKIREASGLVFWISIELFDHRMLFQETKNTQELVRSYREEKKNAALKSATKRGKPKF